MRPIEMTNRGLQPRTIRGLNWLRSAIGLDEALHPKGSPRSQKKCLHGSMYSADRTKNSLSFRSNCHLTYEQNFDRCPHRSRCWDKKKQRRQTGISLSQPVDQFTLHRLCFPFGQRQVGEEESMLFLGTFSIKDKADQGDDRYGRIFA